MIDRQEKREEVGNREVQGEQLKRASWEGRRDLGLRNECGAKTRRIRTKWEVAGREKLQTGEQEILNEELYRAFDGARIKRCIFPCFLCCLLPSVGNIPLLSPPLCSLLPCLTQWEDREPLSGKTNRLLSAAAYRPTVATAGGAGQLSWDLTYRPEWPSSIRHNSLEESRGYGMRGKRDVAVRLSMGNTRR